MKKFNVTVNGTAYEVEVEEIGGTAPASAPTPAPASAPATPVAAGAGDVVCPMPGTIVDMKVKAGDTVKKGDVLAVFEAMKMENEIMAEKDATVTAVYVKKGDAVESGTPLLQLG